jgi:hypothetical protein
MSKESTQRKRARNNSSDDDNGGGGGGGGGAGGAPAPQEIHVSKVARVEVILKVLRTDSGNVCLINATTTGYLGGSVDEPAIVFSRAATFIKFLGIICKILPTCGFTVHVNGEDDARARFSVNIERMHALLLKHKGDVSVPLTLTFPVDDRIFIRVEDTEDAFELIDDGDSQDLRLEFLCGQRVHLNADIVQSAIACARVPPKTDDIRFTVYRPSPNDPVGYVRLLVGNAKGANTTRTIPFTDVGAAGEGAAAVDELSNPAGGKQPRRCVVLTQREPYFDERLSVKYLANLTSTLDTRSSICFIFTPNQPAIITIDLDEDGGSEVVCGDPNTVSMWIAPLIRDT